MKRVWTLLYPGIGVKRWLLMFMVGIILIGTGIAIGFDAKFLGQLEDRLITFIYNLTGQFAGPYLSGIVLIAAGVLCAAWAMNKLVQSIMNTLIPHASGRLVESMYVKRYLEKGPKVVVLGGGTGLSTLLRGIKQYMQNVPVGKSIIQPDNSLSHQKQHFP